MQTQDTNLTIQSSRSRLQSKLIDPLKIKTLLSKKLSFKIPNPEQFLEQIDDHLLDQIEKTQSEILKQRQRLDKIKIVQERFLQARSLMEDKIKTKMQRSTKKKLLKDKEKLQNKIKARQLRQELFTTKKKSIQQAEFRKRLQKFKQIKALNDPKSQSYRSESQQKKRKPLMKRSFSLRSSFEGPIHKRNEIQQIEYFKKLQLVEKKKIFSKPNKTISITPEIDKNSLVEKMNFQIQERLIQKLGNNLWKIQKARRKKQKDTKEEVQKLKKQAEFKQEQLNERLEKLKSTTNEKLKAHRDEINKKNQRFLTFRNKSTPNLQKNWSNLSQYRDNFGNNTLKSFDFRTTKMFRTLQNFKKSIESQRSKNEQYLQKQRENKIRREVLNEVSQIITDEKVEILNR